MPPWPRCARPGFALEAPKAAMYLWVALPAGVASARFAKRALEETGAVVLPGSAFGPAGEGFFRIALTVGADRLREAAAAAGPGARRRRTRGACHDRLISAAAAAAAPLAVDRHRGQRRACTSLLCSAGSSGRHARCAAPAAAADRAGPPAEGPERSTMRYQLPAAGGRDCQRPDGASAGRRPGAAPAARAGAAAAPEPPALPPPAARHRSRPDAGTRQHAG